MRHLLGIHELGVSGIEELLELTDNFAEVNARPIPKVPALRGKTVVLAFFEDSTRTRVSFETAAKRLSADTVSFSTSGTSVSKGESLRDTALTIEAMGMDALVVRHRSSGAPWQLARWLRSGASVVNAGDGWHQHPTQALLDCWTLRRHFGSLGGLHVAVVGDIKHSRVARSNVAAFSLLGADVTMVAPRTLLPPSVDGWAPGPGALKVSNDLDGVLGSVDVVYLLRMQLERQGEALVPSLREYTARFGLTGARADRLRDGAVVLHPGPMNRGVEIAAEVADGPRSLILDQVETGVAVRMAVLFRLLNPGGEPV
ncbi:MAG: aspartate carbamoyltransferase catalytic subunit [Acidimicrobiia bacterium]|jgi:aspartate carbamoyltransferase catalytic subunit|nr:aspartate carbamoyltransferase catalytic subunit [Acidimicrobiia bacterium]